MTRLCFVDTETTSLRADRRAWEIGIIARDPGKPDVEHLWMIDADHLDLGNADLMSLKIGRFFERHPQYRLDRESSYTDTEDEIDALAQVEAVTRGAHLVGAVVSFDAEVLGARMRDNGICPSWHYRTQCVETLLLGWLRGQGIEPPSLPWKSDDLSRLAGIEPPSADERHTALGDARWCLRIWDQVMGGAQ